MQSKLSVKQNGFKDCAAACLLSIIRYYGGNISKDEVSYIIKTDNFGTNAYNLINGAKTIGFEGYGMKVSFNDLLKGFDKPIIAHTKLSNMYHYVVIYEVNKKFFKIMDPSCGIKKISHENFKKMYLGTLIFLYPIKNIPKIKVKDKIFKSIILNMITNKKYIFKTVGLSLIITLLSIIINLYLKVYIDYVYVNFSIKLLLMTTICFIVVIFLKCIFDNIREKILIKIKSIVSSTITNDAINHIMNLPYCYFKNKPSGEIMSRIDDLDNFKELISVVLLNMFVNVFLLVGSMIILIYINNKLFYFSIFIIVIYSIVVLIYSKIFKNKILDVQIKNGIYKKDLLEAINGYETFKNLNLITEITYKLKIRFNAFLTKIKNFEYSYSNERMIKNFISETGIVLLSSFGLLMVYKSTITIGDLVAFTSLVLFFIEPIKELLNLVPSIEYAVNSYERINDLLLIEKENTNNMNKKMINGDIKIENLTYSYNNLNNVFDNVNILIEEGSKYLLYGKSGSGKSTLVKILLKYIDEYKGEITIGSNNLKDIDNDIMRNSITYISQNEIILSDNIKNNIILERKISDKLYNEIINICKVQKIIDKSPMRNNFLLEENGFNISGGERQKIILARGLLKENNIIILDEVLSEVGVNEEIEILKGILKKFDKKTIIYISHKKEIINFFEKKYCFFEERSKHVRQ